MNVEEVKLAKEIALNFIEILEEKQIDAKSWNKIESFINLQYEKEKSKSKLSCNKIALVKLINGQMW